MSDVENESILKRYTKNVEGHLVPKALVSDLDKSRDRLVHSIVKRAKNLRNPLAEFKKIAKGEIPGFIQSSADKYDKKLDGKKGNVSFQNNFTWADFDIDVSQIDQAKYLLLRCLASGIKNEYLAQDVKEFLKKDKKHR